MTNPYLPGLKIVHEMTKNADNTLFVRIKLLTAATGTPAMKQVEGLIMGRVVLKKDFDRLIADLETLGCTQEQQRQLIPLLNHDHVLEALAYK